MHGSILGETVAVHNSQGLGLGGSALEASMQYQPHRLGIAICIFGETEVLHVSQVHVTLVSIGDALPRSIRVLEPEPRGNLILDGVQRGRGVIQAGAGVDVGLPGVRPGGPAPGDGAITILQFEKNRDYLLSVRFVMQNCSSVMEKLECKEFESTEYVHNIMGKYLLKVSL